MQIVERWLRKAKNQALLRMEIVPTFLERVGYLLSTNGNKRFKLKARSEHCNVLVQGKV